mmetsp:Transcript_100815/g.289262  ORF Transcript_100815/g.289262 Transcript_100815/m.289262 type:complete len:242 (-) Transcript_100815:327-1052(-)
MASGIGTAGLFRLVRSETKSITSRRVKSSEPASSSVAPLNLPPEPATCALIPKMSSSSSSDPILSTEAVWCACGPSSVILMIASATSPTYTGWTSPEPSSSMGMAGRREPISPCQLKSRSSWPKSSAGFTITASGNSLRTASSPKYLEREKWLLASGSADRAPTWMNLSTPISFEILASLAGMSMFTSSKPKLIREPLIGSRAPSGDVGRSFLVSYRLPIMLITMSQPSIVRRIESSSRVE